MKKFLISLIGVLMGVGLVTFLIGQTVPLGPMGNLPFTTANVAVDTATLTNVQVFGLLSGTPISAATYTTPTAAQLCAYVRNIVPPVASGFSWDLWVKNLGADADAITVAGGTSITNVGSRTVAQNAVRHLRIVLSNCTSGSEAGSLVSLETAAF
jgi:hypothetical protein